MKLVTADAKCVQVAEYIEKEIRSGRLHAGERLCTVRELCDKFDTKTSVIDAAYDKLEKKKLIVRLPRRGVYVANSPKNLPRKIALITESIGRPDYHESLFATLSRHSCSLQSRQISPTENWEKSIRDLVETHPDLLLVDLGDIFPLETLLKSFGNTPYLFINRWQWDPVLQTDGVYIDYLAAFEQIIRRSLDNGKKTIAFVGHDQPQCATEMKMLQEAASRCGLTYPGDRFYYIYSHCFLLDFDSTLERLKNNPPDVLISSADEYIFEFRIMLEKIAPELLQNTEIVGFHDILCSRLPGYGFSTFRIPYAKFWEEVFNYFSSPGGIRLIAPELILREK